MGSPVQQLAAMAHAAGHCYDCAICGKPFTAARVPKSGGLFGNERHYPGQAVIFLLCRKCARLSRREKLHHLAQGSAGTLLAAAPAKGIA